VASSAQTHYTLPSVALPWTEYCGFAARLPRDCRRSPHVRRQRMAWLHKASERQRIDKVMDRLGYYPPDAPTFGDLCDTADDELFSKARLWSNHVLHALLPPLSAGSQRYNFRQRPHSLQLPEHKTQLSNSNFLIRLLYKNTD